MTEAKPERVFNEAWKGAMTDAKPDALAELKRLRREAHGGACTYAHDFDWPIAALEKERAAINDLLAVLHRDGGHHTGGVGLIQSCQDAQQVRHAFRAAVEKVRERCREEAAARTGPMDDGEIFTELADALDTALRGGA